LNYSHQQPCWQPTTTKLQISNKSINNKKQKQEEQKEGKKCGVVLGLEIIPNAKRPLTQALEQKEEEQIKSEEEKNAQTFFHAFRFFSFLIQNPSLLFGIVSLNK
jgi:hypothetical protein